MILVASGAKYPSPARTKSKVTCLMLVRWAASSFSQAGAGSADGASASTRSGIIGGPLKRKARTPKLQCVPFIIRPGPSDALGTSRRRGQAAPGQLDLCRDRDRAAGGRARPGADRPRSEKGATRPGKGTARGLEELSAGA